MIKTPNFQYDYPECGFHTLGHAGGRKYENTCGATLNTDTNTLKQ